MLLWNGGVLGAQRLPCVVHLAEELTHSAEACIRVDCGVSWGSDPHVAQLQPVAGVALVDVGHCGVDLRDVVCCGQGATEVARHARGGVYAKCNAVNRASFIGEMAAALSSRREGLITPVLVSADEPLSLEDREHLVSRKELRQVDVLIVREKTVEGVGLVQRVIVQRIGHGAQARGELCCRAIMIWSGRHRAYDGVRVGCGPRTLHAPARATGVSQRRHAHQRFRSCAAVHREHCR